MQGTAPPRSHRAAGRREDRPGRPALAPRRLAGPLRERLARACAHGARISPRSGRDGIDESQDGQTDRERPLPSSTAGSAGSSSMLVRNPRYWGPHPPTSTGSFSASADPARCCPPPAQVLAASGRATSTCRPPATRRSSRSSGAFRECGSSRPGVDGWDHLDFRVGAGGHPALRSKLVRRALAYGIDRVAIAQQVLRRGRPETTRRATAPSSGTRIATTAELGQLPLSPRAGPPAARAGGMPTRSRRVSTCAPANGSRFGSRAIAGATASSAYCRADPAPPRQVGVEVVLSYAPSPTLFGQIVRAARSTWSCSRGPRRRACGRASTAAAATHNVHGLLPAARHARPRPGRADPRSRRQRARVLNRVDRRLAKDVPVIPLYQIAELMAYRGRRSGTSSQRPATDLVGTRRTGGSRASPRRGARRLAPRRLGRGRRRARRRRSAAARSSSAGLGEPACLTPLARAVRPRTTALTSAIIAGKVLEAPFAVGPDFTLAAATRLAASTFTTRPPFTLTYHIRPEARWSDGVPITARDFVFTHQAILRYGAPGGSEPDGGSQRPGARREDGQGRPALPLRRLAGALRDRPPAPCARGRGPARVWTDRIDNPKTGAADRERALPRRALGARQADHASSGTRATGGLILPTSTGSSFASAFSGRRAPRRVPARRARRRLAFPPGFVAELQQEPAACGCSRTHVRPAGSTSRSASGRGGHPALRNKLVRQALAYGIDRAAIVEQILGRSIPKLRRSATAPSSRPRARTTGRTGRATATAPPRRGACSSRRAAGAARTASTSAPAAALAPLRDDRSAGGFRRERDRARPGAAPAGGHRGRAESSPRPVRSSGRSSRAATSTSRSSRGSSAPDRVGEVHLRLRRRPELHGLLPAAGDARPRSGRTDPRRRLRQARVLNRADVQMARDVPVIPLYQQTQSAALRSTVRNFGLSLSTHWTRSGTRRTGGSSASASRGARRLAPRRLGSGRLRRADAEARRHGRLRRARPRARLPQRPARRAAAERRPGSWCEKVLRGAVRGRSRLHVADKPRLEGRLHDEAAVHAHVPHPPGGALERRRPGHGAGLRLHAPGDTRHATPELA